MNFFLILFTFLLMRNMGCIEIAKDSKPSANTKSQKNEDERQFTYVFDKDRKRVVYNDLPDKVCVSLKKNDSPKIYTCDEDSGCSKDIRSDSDSTPQECYEFQIKVDDPDSVFISSSPDENGETPQACSPCKRKGRCKDICEIFKLIKAGFNNGAMIKTIGYTKKVTATQYWEWRKAVSPYDDLRDIPEAQRYELEPNQEKIKPQKAFINKPTSCLCTTNTSQPLEAKNARSKLFPTKTKKSKTTLSSTDKLGTFSDIKDNSKLCPNTTDSPSTTDKSTPCPTTTDQSKPFPSSTDTTTDKPTPCPTTTDQSKPCPSFTDTTTDKSTPVSTTTDQSKPCPSSTDTTPGSTTTDQSKPCPSTTDTIIDISKPGPTTTDQSKPCPSTTDTIIDIDKPCPSLEDKSQPYPSSMDKSKPFQIDTDKSKPCPIATDKSTPIPIATDESKPCSIASDKSEPCPIAPDKSKPYPSTIDKSKPCPTTSDESKPCEGIIDKTKPKKPYPDDAEMTELFKDHAHTMEPFRDAMDEIDSYRNRIIEDDMGFDMHERDIARRHLGEEEAYDLDMEDMNRNIPYRDRRHIPEPYRRSRYRRRPRRGRINRNKRFRRIHGEKNIPHHRIRDTRNLYPECVDKPNPNEFICKPRQRRPQRYPGRIRPGRRYPRTSRFRKRRGYPDQKQSNDDYKRTRRPRDDPDDAEPNQDKADTLTSKKYFPSKDKNRDSSDKPDSKKKHDSPEQKDPFQYSAGSKLLDEFAVELNEIDRELAEEMENLSFVKITPERKKYTDYIKNATHHTQCAIHFKPRSFKHIKFGIQRKLGGHKMPIKHTQFKKPGIIKKIFKHKKSKAILRPRVVTRPKRVVKPRVRIQPRVRAQYKAGLRPKVPTQPKMGVQPTVAPKPKVGAGPTTGSFGPPRAPTVNYGRTGHVARIAQRLQNRRYRPPSRKGNYTKVAPVDKDKPTDSSIDQDLDCLTKDESDQIKKAFKLWQDYVEKYKNVQPGSKFVKKWEKLKPLMIIPFIYTNREIEPGDKQVIYNSVEKQYAILENELYKAMKECKTLKNDTKEPQKGKQSKDIKRRNKKQRFKEQKRYIKELFFPVASDSSRILDNNFCQEILIRKHCNSKYAIYATVIKIAYHILTNYLQLSAMSKCCCKSVSLQTFCTCSSASSSTLNTSASSNDSDSSSSDEIADKERKRCRRNKVKVNINPCNLKQSGLRNSNLCIHVCDGLCTCGCVTIGEDRKELKKYKKNLKRNPKKIISRCYVNSRTILSCYREENSKTSSDLNCDSKNVRNLMLCKLKMTNKVCDQIEDNNCNSLMKICESTSGSSSGLQSACSTNRKKDRRRVVRYSNDNICKVCGPRCFCDACKCTNEDKCV